MAEWQHSSHRCSSPPAMSVLWKLQLRHCNGSCSEGLRRLAPWHVVDRTCASIYIVVLVSNALSSSICSAHLPTVRAHHWILWNTAKLYRSAAQHALEREVRQPFQAQKQNNLSSSPSPGGCVHDTAAVPCLSYKLPAVFVPKTDVSHHSGFACAQVCGVG